MVKEQRPSVGLFGTGSAYFVLSLCTAMWFVLFITLCSSFCKNEILRKTRWHIISFLDQQSRIKHGFCWTEKSYLHHTCDQLNNLQILSTAFQMEHKIYSSLETTVFSFWSYKSSRRCIMQENDVSSAWYPLDHIHFELRLNRRVSSSTRIGQRLFGDEKPRRYFQIEW